jgi:transposase InsO family protein
MTTMDSNLFFASNLRQKYSNAGFKKVEAKSLQTTRNVIVKFKSDNGGEYISCAFKKHLTEAKIKHEISTPYYPQQNGKAK